jgi:hypothetical protein
MTTHNEQIRALLDDALASNEISDNAADSARNHAVDAINASQAAADADPGDELEPCPMGCGGLTDDVAGGPCKTCWDNLPDDVDDCWECHEGWRACDDPIQCFAPSHIDIGGDQMHECGDCGGTGTVPRLKRVNR